MKVLVAEDNAVNRMLATRLLEKHGNTVITAENGREALEVLERESVDLVLMDVQMPEMDGLEATAAIRKKESAEGGHVPIIALTAHAMKGDREKCLEAGADEYLTKPIRTPDLFAALDRVKFGKFSAPAGAAPSASPAKSSSLDVLDMEAALLRVEGDRNLLNEIARLYEEECPKTMAGARAALSRGDAQALERLVHTLKGSSANLSALGVQQAAEELERKARSGSLEGAQDQFATLEREVERLLSELGSLLPRVAG